MPSTKAIAQRILAAPSLEVLKQRLGEYSPPSVELLTYIDSDIASRWEAIATPRSSFTLDAVIDALIDAKWVLGNGALVRTLLSADRDSCHADLAVLKIHELSPVALGEIVSRVHASCGVVSLLLDRLLAHPSSGVAVLDALMRPYVESPAFDGMPKEIARAIIASASQRASLGRALGSAALSDVLLAFAQNPRVAPKDRTALGARLLFVACQHAHAAEWARFWLALIKMDVQWAEKAFKSVPAKRFAEAEIESVAQQLMDSGDGRIRSFGWLLAGRDAVDAKTELKKLLPPTSRF